MALRAFEDFTVGETRDYGRHTIETAEMVDFARIYDRQAMHLDAEAARHSFVGTLIASGWQTISLNMRMLADGVLAGAASMGAPGVTELRWLRPVLPGDTLSSRYTVLETKASRSRPDRGFVTVRMEMLNQRDESVMMQIAPLMLTMRAHLGDREAFVTTDATPAGDWFGKDGLDQTGLEPASVPENAELPGFGKVEVGSVIELGRCTFHAEDILRFGRAFDPQPFHLDEAAGRSSHFGGLAASGWQTACVWMRLMMANRDLRAERMSARGETPPRFGPSPGFSDLRWVKGVLAGDTLTYTSTALTKRLSQSRPGWGIVSHLNEAFNSRGELVFAFKGNVFLEDI